MTHPVVRQVTEQIIRRSEKTRRQYLANMAAQAGSALQRGKLSCGNLAHVCAASEGDKASLLAVDRTPNLAIVTAYNDMLSAHQPYHAYPDIIKQAARHVGAVAQVAGGVPAMCDGVTQGQDGMELSLFSRDVIAMSTAVALSHQVFDGALLLGICDKIVPGLLIGALRFGFLPTLFVPAGPMSSGLPNAEKARVRQLYAEGKVGRDALLKAESESYHSAGTCTFYGTANSNQMLLEIMGLQLPGSAFINPDSPLRQPLTDAAVAQLVANIQNQQAPMALAEIVDERCIVNGIVGLLATGGSTNHTIHLLAIAKAAGIIVNWQDMATLSSVVPLLCRIYPNGQADINHFQAAGGMSFLIAQLLHAKLLHADANTVLGPESLTRYVQEPTLQAQHLTWQSGAKASLDEGILRPATRPFSERGGLAHLRGNMGEAIIKVSAVAPNYHCITAPARVFDDQQSLVDAFDAGELNRDFIAVVRFQGPKANGMPELHKLMPALGVLQDRGYKVALVTDGRLSGASGKVAAAIHLTPEALFGGSLAKIQDGDRVTLDATNGLLELHVDASELAARPLAKAPAGHQQGVGRELFSGFRALVGSADTGASVFSEWDQGVVGDDE